MQFSAIFESAGRVHLSAFGGTSALVEIVVQDPLGNQSVTNAQLYL